MARRSKPPPNLPLTPSSNDGPAKTILPRNREFDPTEVVQRIISRRQLVIEDGDLVIVRTAGGIGDSTPTRMIYQLRVRGHGPLPERFVGFDRAAIEGERIAISEKVRLFCQDSELDPPFLLRDFR